MLVAAGCGEAPEPDPARSEAARGPGTDSLVVLLLRDSVPLALAPRDWVDLFHPRFGERVSFPDPSASPEAEAFMAAVMEREARRTGDPSAGFDWLRRLDRAVLFYPEEPESGIAAFFRGEVVLLVLEGRHSAGVLERDGVALAPMESGGAPFPGIDAALPVDSTTPAIPPRWLTRWRTDVRGRG